jgi:hypothetical protein
MNYDDTYEEDYAIQMTHWIENWYSDNKYYESSRKITKPKKKEFSPPLNTNRHYGYEFSSTDGFDIVTINHKHLSHICIGDVFFYDVVEFWPFPFSPKVIWDKIKYNKSTEIEYIGMK